MTEDKDLTIKEKSSEVVLEPIGVRVIGDIDPRTLSEKEFNQSPDLLFHGAMGDFEFSREYDYRSPDYYEKSDGSQTLGEGFYTTAERDVAENYSILRQTGQEISPVVVEVLPYQAKVLDLRAKTDQLKTAPVSEDFFNKWYEKFTTYYKTDDPRENLPWYVHAGEAEYMSYLNTLKKLRPTPDLRVMLGTAPTGTLEIPTLNYPSPPWMKLFSNFMIEEGYDGLIHNEGGEGKDAKNHTSYVFYNLETVGNFESWHEQE
ncbi:MAG: hypothetical protein ACW963_01110 [Candidatus Sifarchaeia archaeon]